MTKLGAKKKRGSASATTTISLTLPKTRGPARSPKKHEIWTEKQAKTACAICLFLMLLSDLTPHQWYMQCVENAWAYPGGSYRSTFWWSLRFFLKNDETLDKFGAYFEWKRGEFDSGRIKRDGPVW